MTIIIDSKFNRAFFTPGNNQKSEEITLNDVESCWDHEITLIPKLTEVYEPLEVEMIFKILDNIPQSGNQFCDSCVIFDLKETATVSNKVAFITGCEGTQCVSELSLDGKIIDVTQPYIIGTTKTIVIQYELTNTGENAYLTQLMISIPTNVTQFSKTQPNCKLSNQNSLMTCSILDGKPIQRNQKIDLFISLDMSRIQGSSLRVNASVTCAGINSNEENSSTDNIIMFSELSEIQITSEKPKLNISVDDDESLKEITYTYKIINKGPSIVREMKIKIPIPIKYLTPKKELTIVDLEEGSISCQYDNNKFEVLMLDHVADDSLIYYSGGIEDQTASDLIDNKTIIFDCSNSSRIICTNAILEIPNFKSNNDIIDITIKLKVHLDNIGKCLNSISLNRKFYFIFSQSDEIFRLEENYNTFLYKLNAKLHRVGEGKLIVSITNPYTLINASFTVITPYMIIGISIICGILVLLLVIYVLYRMGFFKRAKKAEINQYRRESRRMTQRIKEAALNPANDVEELEKEVFSNNDEMVKQLKSKQSKKNLTVEGTDEPRPSTSNKRASFRVEQSIVLDVNKK